MRLYIAKRLLLIIPTLFGILLLNFVVVQAAPGGPVEKTLAELQGIGGGAGGSFAGGSVDTLSNGGDYRGSKGLPPELVERIQKLYGFDKPAPERFWLMVKSYLSFDFGESYYRDRSVTELIVERIPVSLSLGLWSTLIAYMVSIPLGIHKAVKDGSRFDIWSSTAIVVGFAIPSFLLGILLIVLFAGGSYFEWFPLRGLTSDNFEQLSLFGKVSDYLWHITLPTLAIVAGSFATLTMLTKNSFMDEIRKQYVQTARAKGLSEKQVLYGHVFRNAMLIIIAGFPAAFVGMFFTGVLLIEFIFSLDGLGLLGFESVINRDYPVVFGTLFIFTLIGLLLKLVSDLTYMWVDPRIDFERRQS
ncbi:microcin ABC transporter permease [Alcanivorax sp. HI0083]|uniref:microcin C ABC transporter permease YejB n=1 Tax=unclassified Alcanivorax TaxID=2638842 RepID=UPI0007BA8675|nr:MULTISPECIES: microcin C ABC transporter permease YejB [unclassified Alcanivorax]KZY32813.1 microcin ABC transporter permease [Alcanivorax sp. HI0044]KZZ30228.1 microcin ABC transporter permease [Alcanivorax sp. HI0083]